MQDLEQSYVKTFAKDDLELSTKDLSVLYGGKIQKRQHKRPVFYSERSDE